MVMTLTVAGAHLVGVLHLEDGAFRAVCEDCSFTGRKTVWESAKASASAHNARLRRAERRLERDRLTWALERSDCPRNRTDGPCPCPDCR